MKQKHVPAKARRSDSTSLQVYIASFRVILANASFWVVTSVVCTVLVIALFPLIFNYPGALVVILFQCGPLVVLSPIMVVVLAIRQRKETVQDIKKLALLYLALIIQCANLYFLLVIVTSPFGKSFHGISFQDVSVESEKWGLSFYWSAFLTYVDCLHYSVVTTTTSQVGDITPTQWYTKLLTDAQLLASVAIAVVGLGQYFSPSSREARAGIAEGRRDI